MATARGIGPIGGAPGGGGLVSNSGSDRDAIGSDGGSDGNGGSDNGSDSDRDGIGSDSDLIDESIPPENNTLAAGTR